MGVGLGGGNLLSLLTRSWATSSLGDESDLCCTTSSCILFNHYYYYCCYFLFFLLFFLLNSLYLSPRVFSLSFPLLFCFFSLPFLGREEGEKGGDLNKWLCGPSCWLVKPWQCPTGNVQPWPYCRGNGPQPSISMIMTFILLSEEDCNCKPSPRSGLYTSANM